MSSKIKIFVLLLVCTLALSGCGLLTLEELYCLPKRSEEYDNLQSLIDEAMEDLTYSAPISGDNRQSVQVADLDGDGNNEYLLFAKDESETPMKILIFSHVASGYVLMDTIDGYGFAFDFVEYAQIDDNPGVEIVVGRQVSEDLPKSVSVYRFSSGFARQMLSTGYTGLACEDLNRDGFEELVLFTAGKSERDNGSVVLYSYEAEELQRSVISHLSRPISFFQQVKSGMLQDGSPAVFATSAENDGGLLLDVFVLSGEGLTNLTEGMQIPAVRNYFLYPEDIDEDGVVEIPQPLQVNTITGGRKEYVLQWQSLDKNAVWSAKGYTYHNHANGWYFRLGSEWIEDLTVVQAGNMCSFYLGAVQEDAQNKLFSIYALTDSDREEESALSGRILLYKGDSVIFVAEMGALGSEFEIENKILEIFTPIRKEWNTEEDGKSL